jgi:hypothetical protein
MSRKLMAVLISSALLFGNVSTSAWSATDTSNAVQTQAVQATDGAKNLAPLPAGGAAGIRQAQGVLDSPWVGIGLVAAIVGIAWVLIDNNDNDDDSSSGTGTN